MSFVGKGVQVRGHFLDSHPFRVKYSRRRGLGLGQRQRLASFVCRAPKKVTTILDSAHHVVSGHIFPDVHNTIAQCIWRR